MPASLAPFIVARPWLFKLFKPAASWYANAATYRQVGLYADDLISEENEDVQQALKRLPPRQSYDRVFRLRRATQLSLQQKILPRDQWTKPEEDKPYLGPLLSTLEAESREREALDTLTVLKNK